MPRCNERRSRGERPPPPRAGQRTGESARCRRSRSGPAAERAGSGRPEILVHAAIGEPELNGPHGHRARTAGASRAPRRRARRVGRRSGAPSERVALRSRAEEGDQEEYADRRLLLHDPERPDREPGHRRRNGGCGRRPRLEQPTHRVEEQDGAEAHAPDEQRLLGPEAGEVDGAAGTVTTTSGTAGVRSQRRSGSSFGSRAVRTRSRVSSVTPNEREEPHQAPKLRPRERVRYPERVPLESVPATNPAGRDVLGVPRADHRLQLLGCVQNCMPVAVDHRREWMVQSELDSRNATRATTVRHARADASAHSARSPLFSTRVRAPAADRERW